MSTMSKAAAERLSLGLVPGTRISFILFRCQPPVRATVLRVTPTGLPVVQMEGQAREYRLDAPRCRSIVVQEVEA